MLSRSCSWVIRAGCCLLLLTGPLHAEASPANWPGFRGPGASGVAENPRLPDRWSPTENIAWQTDLPGRGWSSPIVWGNYVFLTTVVSDQEPEPARKGLYFGGERDEAPTAPHQWKVFCIALDSGNILWERVAHEGIPSSPVHIKNTYASETPVTDGTHVFVYFGNVGVWCFDFNGNERWRRSMPAHKTRFNWGPAASPVLHENRLYIVNDNEEDSYLLALDKVTGEEVLRISREEKSNWSTPFVWTNEIRTEIVTPGTGQNRSYDLDGNLLWTLKGMSGITIATPYAAEGLLFISSGYVGDRRRPLYAIRPGASGDISLGKDETANDWIAWSHPQAAPYNPTTVAYQGRVYVLHDGGMLACFDARSGAPVFERQRIPEARNFTASPWAYNGLLFCLNEDGITWVLNAGDALQVKHTNSLGDEEMFMATPAIAGDALLIRGSRRLYCIRK